MICNLALNNEILFYLYPQREANERNFLLTQFGCTLWLSYARRNSMIFKI